MLKVKALKAKIKETITDIQMQDQGYNRKYYYYDIIDTGFEKSTLQDKYSNTREGYELFKKENDVLVDISTKTVREVYENNKLKYFILEETESSNDKYLKYKNLYIKLLNEIKITLNVKDDAAFMYYIKNNVDVFSSFNGIQNLKTSITSLYDFIEEYYNDDEFKEFIDKIKG